MSFPRCPSAQKHEVESLVRCPFNPEHKMCESSLQRHILRCMVKYPSYVSCPYNSLHFFRTKELLQNHIENCPCRPDSIDTVIKNDELIHDANLEHVRKWNMEFEDWDNEYKNI